MANQTASLPDLKMNASIKRGLFNQYESPEVKEQKRQKFHEIIDRRKVRPEELGLPSIMQRPETPYNPKAPDREDQKFFYQASNSPRNAAEKIKRLVDVDFFSS
jgi:hypothetical protein